MQSALGTGFGRPAALRPATRSPRAVPAWVRPLGEVLTVAVATLLYFLARGFVDGREAEAVRHAEDLIRLERDLGIFWEPRLQGWALDLPVLGTLANWVYIWGHWPVIAATLTWLLVAHRDAFPTYRNALLLSGAVGLVIFTLYPMAPPRFIEAQGFVDTITLHSQAYRVLQPPSLVNQYAAMPSLHVGWDLLMGIAIATHARGRLRVVGWVLPALMVAAVVLTANHYLLDGVVGAALVLASLRVVRATGELGGAFRLPRPAAALTARRA